MTEKGGQVLPLLGAPPEGDLDQPLDRVFFALSDPIRRAILNELDKGPRLVSELAAPFDISLQAVSRHIQVLVRAGLVQQRLDTAWLGGRNAVDLARVVDAEGGHWNDGVRIQVVGELSTAHGLSVLHGHDERRPRGSVPFRIPAEASTTRGTRR